MLAATAAVAFLVLASPPVGLADNGDSPKMIARFALTAEPAAANDAPAYLVLKYVRDPKVWWVSDNYSTEIPLVATALAISDLAGAREFDIRILGAIHGTLFLLGFGGLLLVLRVFPVRAMVLIACVAFFLLGDACYLVYCNTFYTDASALAFVFPSLVLAVAIALSDRPGPLLLAGFAVCSCLFIFSKGQHALPAVLLAGFLVVAGRSRWLLSLALSIAMLAASYFSFVLAPPQERPQYLFTLIFYKLAPDASTAPAVLAGLGLGPEYAKYAGLFTYAPNSPMNDPAFAEEFGRKASTLRVARYYLHHPGEALRLLQYDLHYWAREMRSDSLGNYPKSAGKPPLARSMALGWWSWLRSGLFANAEFYAVAWYLFVFGAGATTIYRRGSMLAVLWVAVAGMGVAEFLITSLADAGETARHLLLFHYLTDFTVVLFVLLLERHYKEWRPQGDSNPCYRRERAVS